MGNLLGGNWVGAPPPGHEDEGYWPLADQEDLPTAADPDGNTDLEAILPLCKSSGGSTGAYGFLDLVGGMNLQQEIEGPLNTSIDLPDWFQVQTGNPNSVDDELEDSLTTRTDPASQPGVSCTKYRSHGRVPIGRRRCGRPDRQQHLVSRSTSRRPRGRGHYPGRQRRRMQSPRPLAVPKRTTTPGFLGCLKGWFVTYVPGEVDPNTPINLETTIGIQLIK